MVVYKIYQEDYQNVSLTKKKTKLIGMERTEDAAREHILALASNYGTQGRHFVYKRGYLTKKRISDEKRTVKGVPMQIYYNEGYPLEAYTVLKRGRRDAYGRLYWAGLSIGTDGRWYTIELKQKPGAYLGKKIGKEEMTEAARNTLEWYTEL